MVLIILVVAMVWIGESRIGIEDSSFSMQNIIKKVLVQSTATDVAFSYNCAIDFCKYEPLLLGKTYFKYIIEIIPLIDSSSYEVGTILQQKYGTPGGNFILNEPMINFGVIGVIIYAVLEFYLYDKLLSKKSKFRYYIYAFFIFTTFRTTWYGWMFVEKALIYFIPILYFIVYRIDKKELRKQKNVKNVIIYSEKWTTGGIESFIMNIFKNIDKENIKIDIMCSENDTELYDETLKQADSKKIVTLNKKYKSPIIRMIANIIGFTKKIITSDCDILHLNICNGVALYYAFIAKVIGIDKIIIHSHNTDVGSDNKSIKLLGHKLGKKLFLWCGSDYLACSDLAAEWLFTKKQIEEGKVKIINNGIDVKKFTFSNKKRQEIRTKLNLKEEQILCGHIGRFGEQKNHTFLIDIFEEIYKNEKNAILLLVGNGELEDNIKEKLKQKGLEKQVIFYGITNQTDYLLSAMDVFILPSLFEGNPVVGIEAQTSGIKCFFADTITKKAQITDLVTFIPLEESKKWAKIILENTNYERKNQTENIIKAGYDIENITKTLKQIYMG